MTQHFQPISEAAEAIRQSSPESRVYIGCDSKRYRKGDTWFARYTTVVILHVDGCKGARVFHETETQRDFGNIHQRMLMEANQAVQCGLKLRDAIGDRVFEIHLDINGDDKYPSHVALKAARGLVLGSLGIEPLCKPNSPAATHGADHVVKGKHERDS